MKTTVRVIQTMLLKQAMNPLGAPVPQSPEVCQVICQAEGVTLNFQVAVEYAPAIGDRYDVEIIQRPALGARIGEFET